jgi:hypothetical protein
MDAIKSIINLGHPPKSQQSTISGHMERTRNVMFPSSKKKRLCRVNGRDVADSGEAVFVDSTGKPHGLIETFSLVIALESLGRAVSMESRERLVDVDGESAVVVEAVGDRWSMSGLFTH